MKVLRVAKKKVKDDIFSMNIQLSLEPLNLSEIKEVQYPIVISIDLINQWISKKIKTVMKFQDEQVL